MAVGGALGAPFARGGLVAVAQPVHGVLQQLVVFGFRPLEAHAHHDHGFGVDFPAEADELVGAEAVLVVVEPLPVVPTAARFLRADAPFPVVLGRVTAARPAQAGRMQVLDRLEDVGPEAAEGLSGAGAHGGLVDEQGAVLGGDGEVRIALVGPCVEGELIFLPVGRRAAQALADEPFSVLAEPDAQPRPAVALGIDGAHERVAGPHGLGALLQAGNAPGADLLGVVHVDGVALDKPEVAFAEGRPLGSDVGHLHLFGHAGVEDLLAAADADVAVEGLGIIFPEGDRILLAAGGDAPGEDLLPVPPDGDVPAAAADLDVVPGLLVDLGGLGGLRGEGLQRHDPAGAAAEAGHLLLHLRGEGELGAHGLLLGLGERLGLGVGLDLRLGLGQCETLPLVGGIVEPQEVRLAVGLVLHGPAQVQQTAAPAPSGQLVGAPLHVHLDVVAVGVELHQLDGLLVAGGRVQHLVGVGEPAVEVAVARGDAGVVLRLEGAAVDDLLPDAVVGGEIDVLEELAVDERVDVPVDGPGVHPEADVVLGVGREAGQERSEQEKAFRCYHFDKNCFIQI